MTAVKTHDIPSDLKINVDERGLWVIPVDKWMLEKKGMIEAVARMGQEDKCEITYLLGCTLYGNMLPPQAIYQSFFENSLA